MAVYKVPQDVEAEDKLLGPFSFRQFIYLIIVAISIFIGYVLSQIFIALAIVVLPIVLLFGALALPLRKDQPMETYLAAMIRFFLKPRFRLWTPEGTISMVTITVPQAIEQQLTKDFGGNEAEKRLSYLAQIVDTEGWSSRGVTSIARSTIDPAIYAEAHRTEDVFDEDARVTQSFEKLIARSDTSRKESMRSQFQSAWQHPDAPAPQPATTPAPAEQTLPADVNYDPYPVSMRQHIIDPTPVDPALTQQQPQPQPQSAPPAPAASQPAFTAPPPPTPAPTPEPPHTKPVTPQVSPDIMRLANNKDLSVSALAREAHRIEDKEDEVVISLR